tara:strand:- start:218 stop:724 length:507 start_codon:yes stop_codon:yes gene_type:complete
MNLSNKFKNCSNCKKSYEITKYISKRSTKEKIIYTEVCEKCRTKNSSCNKHKKESVANTPLPTGFHTCVNCKKNKSSDNFVSKTGKRILKVCYTCRNSGKIPKQNVQKKETVQKADEIMYTNEINISDLGTKFICEGCNKEFISVALFSKIPPTMCTNCKLRIRYSSP